METAILDANVIFQGGLRDFLLSVAARGAFLPAWSDEIHAEWMRSRVRVYDDPPERLDYTKSQMEDAFEGSCMPPDPDILNDILSHCSTGAERKDAHVIMTAVVAEAGTIVTFNTSDFPQHVLSRYNLRKEKPDAFCCRILPGRLDNFVAGAKAHRERLAKPSRDPEDYLRHLADPIGMPGAAALLRPHIARL